MATHTQTADFYNESYKTPNYFHYRSWLYEPYVSSLIAFCGLKEGASVLDVGCGQGLFSYLFSKNGMRVHGIDVSETGIRAAQEFYRNRGITFAVSDIESDTFQEQFDCVFVRSCSLYNTTLFPIQSQVSEHLVRHLKAEGTFIFAYSSNFSSKASPTWRYHSLEDVEQHFSGYPNAQVFFLNKLTTYLFRTSSFTQIVKHVNVLLSKALGMGGDVICILRKPRLDSTVSRTH